MKQKNEAAALKKKHQKVLKRHKMRPLFWVVVREVSRESDTILICKNRITGEFRWISK